MDASKFCEFPELCSTENKKDHIKTGQGNFRIARSPMDF